MKVLLLGAGAQGKAVLHDLLKNQDISKIVVIEHDASQLEKFKNMFADSRIGRVEYRQGDANDKEKMLLFMHDVDIVIDLLPTPFRRHIAQLAIEARVNLVNTSFVSHIEDLHNDASMAGITIMPESGLDPGIDLILAGAAIKKFDEVTDFSSSCGGVPIKEHADNPINYKVSWIFEGVLSAYKRPGNLIRDGEVVIVPGENIFDYSEEVDVEGVGRFDRYPNGYATTYAKLLGISDVKNMARYTLRWPGHSAFWKKISELGLIDDEPVLGISPRKFMARVMEPKLRYADHEKDMIVLVNDIRGIKDGKKMSVGQLVVDERDMKTGLMAMNRTVGFTASIVAQMIMAGKIKEKGILNPGTHVSYYEFISELEKRGIKVEERVSYS